MCVEVVDKQKLGRKRRGLGEEMMSSRCPCMSRRHCDAPWRAITAVLSVELSLLGLTASSRIQPSSSDMKSLHVKEREDMAETATEL